MVQFRPGDVVRGLFSGQWYLATVDQDNGDGTYTISWMDGDESNRVKPADELKLMRFDRDAQHYLEADVQKSPNLQMVPQACPAAEQVREGKAELAGEESVKLEVVPQACSTDEHGLEAKAELAGEDVDSYKPVPVGTLTLDDGMCLYINLDRREDRKRNLEELAAPHKWLSSAMTRIAAVNGDGLSWSQLISDGLFTVEARIMAERAKNMRIYTIAADPEECSMHLTLGGCGCALSHRKAWQALVESQATWALVLEDDLAWICQSFDDELKAVLGQLPENFTVCYLGFHTGEVLPDGEHFEGPLVQQEEGWLAGLWSYMISRSGAEIMLARAVPFEAQVDWVVGVLAVQDGRCYAVPPGQFLAFSPPTEESLNTDVQTLPPTAETEEQPMVMTQMFSDIALHDAALQGLSDVCLTILGRPDSTEDLNARDASGQTALHAAAWAGLTDVSMAILGRPDFTMVNAIDDEGNSVLHAAAFKGLSDVCMKILASSEFTEAAAEDCDRRTASSLAEEKGHSDLAKILLDHGA